MAISQGKSTRSPSGARNVANRGKRKSELGRDPAETRLDEKKLRKIRTRGGNEKLRLATGNKINVTDANGKTLKIEVEENIQLRGDEREIRQLISLLLDNAVKYSKECSEIEIKLQTNGKSKEITVKNPVESIRQGRLDRLFERFYREDGAHNSKTGGSGIGLSVAEAIVNAHRGKISAHSPDGKNVIFNVLL